jgi:hypothetical protein
MLLINALVVGILVLYMNVHNLTCSELCTEKLGLTRCWPPFFNV